MTDPGFLFLHNVPGYDPAALKAWTLWFFKVQPSPCANGLPR